MIESMSLPEPTDPPYDLGERLCDYLDHFRAVVAEKTRGLPASELRGSRLPSGWSPIELVKHLVHMERRWLVWGFLAEQVERPWGDDGPDGRWSVAPDTDFEALLDALAAGGRRTREIVTAHDLGDRGRTGGRFATDPPTLEWILLHVLQEYARHVGHLDVVRELVDGRTGE